MKVKIMVMGIIASLCSLLGCNAQNGNFKSVEVDEFEKVISDKDVVRLDVIKLTLKSYL